MYLINEALPVGFRSCKEKGKSGEGAGRGFPLLSTVRREESGWCLQQIKETRIIKRPQSPFIFLLFFPLISFVAAVLSACLFPPSEGVGSTRALAEVVVCAVGRVVTLPAVEITAQATALLVLVMISCRWRQWQWESPLYSWDCMLLRWQQFLLVLQVESSLGQRDK